MLYSFRFIAASVWSYTMSDIYHCLEYRTEKNSKLNVLLWWCYIYHCLEYKTEKTPRLNVLLWCCYACHVLSTIQDGKTPPDWMFCCCDDVTFAVVPRLRCSYLGLLWYYIDSIQINANLFTVEYPSINFKQKEMHIIVSYLLSNNLLRAFLSCIPWHYCIYGGTDFQH